MQGPLWSMIQTASISSTLLGTVGLSNNAQGPCLSSPAGEFARGCGKKSMYTLTYNTMNGTGA